MTTIAFKDGILAADTQLTTGSVKTLCRKIKIYPNDIVAAAAGNDTDLAVFMEWYLGDKTKKTPKNLAKYFEIIILGDGDPVAYDKECIAKPIEDPIYSNGSGWAIARAGMLCGLSAKDAVKLAGEIDTSTNTIVDVYDTKKRKLILSKFS